MTAAGDAVGKLTRWVDDFPAPGIRFADLTPVFADHDGFRAVIDALRAIAPDTELVAGIDARGFLLASGVAVGKGCGVLAVRKGGKLPPPVLSREYDLEYGTARLEIPADGIDIQGKRVLLIDDVLATGGTIVAAAELLTEAGAHVVATAVVLELSALQGRKKIGGRSELGELTALVQI
ncbi:adenine phosphoribosyltransferase [Antrihabitans sp. YC2-6]|uniref:adenine phosphoribosyltransferase n=1 Tax=Antrihabitans sp. YC2-6 TaxID=2799498 RepID=UPI0018F61329|nr:adenine phosphoribosyltransferase [Antrihabitans sp. YC2-6]MBJ8345264.1 adenine phosphoribosyltransferase [Antrihabitans sp. YC2-6]